MNMPQDLVVAYTPLLLAITALAIAALLVGRSRPRFLGWKELKKMNPCTLGVHWLVQRYHGWLYDA